MKLIGDNQENRGLACLRTCFGGLAFGLLGITNSLAQPACPTNLPIRITVGPVPGVSLADAQMIRVTVGSNGTVNAAGHLFCALESRSSLGSNDSWVTLEPLDLGSNGVTWQSVAPPSGSQFFRTVLPAPQIFRVEPAVASPSGGATIYVLGQCLGTNGQARVGGLTLPPNVLSPGSVYSFTCPALPPGTYDVDWIEGGVVVASAAKLFSVTGQPTPVGEASNRLLEPPEEPPASPMGKIKNHGVVTGNITVSSGYRLNVPDGDDLDHDLWPEASMMKVKEKGNRTKCTSNLRVIPPTGEVQLEAVDMAIPGVGLDFVFSRIYRSRTGRTTPMGVNWDHCFNISAQNNASSVTVCNGHGRCDDYFRQTNGTFTCNEFFNEGSLSNGVFTLTFPDTGRWEFSAFDGSASGGKLSRILDRNGNALTCSYSQAGLLLAIIDTLGRTNTISYNADGFITAVTDFTGRSVSYGYARTVSGVVPPGVLTAVTNPPVTGTPNGNDFPAGKTTRYTYSQGFSDERLNRNLTACFDGKSQQWLTITYQPTQDSSSPDFDGVGMIQRGQFRSKLVRLPQTPSPANGFAVRRCIENDAVGNIIECYYDSLNRCVRQLEFTGRSNPDLPTTDTQNRPVNKLRADDPDYFETLYEWNLDSLCTRVTRPRGDATEMVYQRAYNQNNARSNHARRHDADLRVVRLRACCKGGDTDGDGLGDADELSWHFDYDPRFGSGRQKPLATWIKDPMKGEDRRRMAMMSGNEGVWNFHVWNNCNITRATDPLGNVGSATYDDHGNCTHTETTERKSGAIIACDFNYNEKGQRTVAIHPVDGNGQRRRDEYFYYSTGPQNGYLSDTVKDCLAAGFHTTNRFEYDALGRITRHVDPRGFDSLWTWNALDQVATRQTPQTSFGTLVRYATTYTYDANDNLTQVDTENRGETGDLDADNPLWTTSYEYDLLDRCSLVAHELAHVVQQRSITNRFFYDGNDNLVLQQLPEAVSGEDPANVVSHTYDERDLPFETVAAPGTNLGATNRFDYDSNGNCARVSKIEAFSIKQSVVTFSYDGLNRRVFATDPMGNVGTCGYDRLGNLVYERLDGELEDAEGSAGNRPLSESRYSYDSLSRLTSSRMSFFDPTTGLAIGDGAATSSFSYAPNGLLLSETDDNGNTTQYAYDSLHRLLTTTDAKTNRLTRLYDASGNCTSLTQRALSDLGGVEQVFTLSTEYDGLGRRVRQTDNLGNSENWTFDSHDNVVRHRDPRTNDTIFAYDGLGRCTDTTHYVGEKEKGITINTSHVEYKNARCVSATDGNGNTTQYFYDSLDRRVRTHCADGTECSLIWSPRSNLARMTNANGTVIQFTYDLMDRCARKDITPGAGVAATTTFEQFSYDGASRLVRASNNGVSHVFAWNSLSDCTRQTQTGGDGIPLSLSATFDGVGNRLSLTYPSGAASQHTYDSLNHPSAMSLVTAGQAKQVATFSYDGGDRLSQIRRANNINTRINWNGYSGSGQSAGDQGWQQVLRVNHATAGGIPVIDQRIFSYDSAQNMILRAQTAPSLQGGLATNMFSYDALERLTGSESMLLRVPRTTVYQLDSVGNRQVVTENGAAAPYQMDATLPQPADFQMNQYSLTPWGTRQYDLNGNLTVTDDGSGAVFYQYDYADRLVSVQRAVGAGLTPMADYAYDALGRRVSKTSYPLAPAAPATVTFVCTLDGDRDDIVEMRTSAGLTANVMHDEDNFNSLLVANGATRYLHKDYLGNVLAMTDEGGKVVERYEYSDYGAPTFLNDAGAVLTGSGGFPSTSSPAGNPFLFQGMYWDGETKLYHESGRSGSNPLYEPATGRYTGRPPRCSDGSCASAFEGNNPWSSGGGGQLRAGVSTSRSNIRSHRSLSAGGGGDDDGDGAPSMRAGISTSRSNLRTKTGIMATDWDGGGGGNSGGEMRAGISTSRSNLRTKKGFIDGGGGPEMRAGISTSRSNIRCRSLAVAGDEPCDVMFNPKEYSVNKVIVRGWDPEKKREIVGKEEGGRPTPFHNKYRPAACLVGDDDRTPIVRGSALGGLNKEPKWVAFMAAGDMPAVRLIVPVAMDKGLRFSARTAFGGFGEGWARITLLSRD